MAEDTTSTDDVEVTRAPTLPGLELPEYHGRKPGSRVNTVGGHKADNIARLHEIGERVVLVVEVRCDEAGHRQTADGLAYKETFSVSDSFEVEGAAGVRLLSTVRQAYREADDERLGRQPLPLEDEGTTRATTGDGTVLTPAELAELRGDPAAALTDERLTPVVVVYSDGARELWPDDFDPDETKPAAGQVFEVDGDDGGVATVYVREVLNAETGEVIEQWTDDQQAARLLEMEHAAEADEAAASVDVDVEPTIAYYRCEMADGSVIEVDAAKAPASPSSSLGPAVDAAVRIYAVTDDGSEMLYKGRDDDLPGAPLGGTDLPPLPGEDLPANTGLAGAPLGEAPAPASDEGPDLEPTPDDYTLVDTDLDIVRLNVAGITDLAHARRVLEAEKRGRGRGLKTRKGATDVILARIAELEKEPTT